MLLFGPLMLLMVFLAIGIVMELGLLIKVRSKRLISFPSSPLKELILEWADAARKEPKVWAFVALLWVVAFANFFLRYSDTVVFQGTTFAYVSRYDRLLNTTTTFAVDTSSDDYP
jgi:hypothetical protein